MDGIAIDFCVTCEQAGEQIAVYPPNYCKSCEQCYCGHHISEYWCGLCETELVCDDCDQNDVVCAKCGRPMCDTCVKTCPNCDEYFCLPDGGEEECFTECVSCENAVCSDCREGFCNICKDAVCNSERCSVYCDRCSNLICSSEDCLKRHEGRDLCANCNEELEDDYGCISDDDVRENYMSDSGDDTSSSEEGEE